MKLHGLKDNVHNHSTTVKPYLIWNLFTNLKKIKSEVAPITGQITAVFIFLQYNSIKFILSLRKASIYSWILRDLPGAC